MPGKYNELHTIACDDGKQSSSGVCDEEDEDMLLRNVSSASSLHQSSGEGADDDRDYSQSATNHTVPLWKMFAAVLVPCIVLLIFGPGLNQHQRGAALIFSVASVFWAIEIIPLWVTGLLVVFMAVVLPIDDTTSADRAQVMLASLGSSNVFLMMGGFVMAKALAVTQLDSFMAKKMLGYFPRSPRAFTLCVMLLSFGMCMFLNNVVTPVIMMALMQPIMTTNEGTPKLVALAITFACNIGGMPAPISSPQNAAALGALHISCTAASSSAPMSKPTNCELSFLEWMRVAVPVGICLIVWTWACLLRICPPDLADVNLDFMIASNGFVWNKHRKLTAAVCLTTCFLWLTFDLNKPTTGSMGTIALLPIILLFGTHILQSSHLGEIDWKVILLLAGGQTLGTAVQDSTLLQALAQAIVEPMVAMPLPIAAFMGAIFVLVFTNFVSHTVGALALLPVVAQVSACQLDANVKAFVLIGALAASAACCLPVSSFPNLVACAARTKESGNSIVHRQDFMKVGLALAAGYCVIFPFVLYPIASASLEKCIVHD